MGKVIVEVIKPHQKQRDLKEFDSLAVIHVGRGLKNDLMISDEYVSEEHLVIRSDQDGWVVEDLDSANGMFVTKMESLEKKVHIESGDEIIIGKTRLRIYSPSHPVPPAKLFAQKSNFLRIISQPLVAWLIVSLMFVIFTIDEHLASIENLPIQRLISASIFVVIIAIIGAGVWAFIGRLIKYKASFSAQLAVISLFFIVILSIDIITGNLGYHTSSLAVDTISFAVLTVVVFTLLLVGNLSIATNIARRKQIAVSSVITLIIIAISMILYFPDKDAFDPKPGYYAILKPPIIKPVHSYSIGTFLKDSQKVFEIKDGK